MTGPLDALKALAEEWETDPLADLTQRACAALLRAAIAQVERELRVVEEWRVSYPDGITFDGYTYDIRAQVDDDDATFEHRTVTTWRHETDWEEVR